MHFSRFRWAFGIVLGKSRFPDSLTVMVLDMLNFVFFPFQPCVLRDAIKPDTSYVAFRHGAV